MAKERRKGYPDMMNRLTDIEIGIGVINNKVENLHKSKNEAISRIDGNLQSLHKVVYGNGAKGLITRVMSCLDNISALSEKQGFLQKTIIAFCTLLMIVLGWILTVLYSLPNLP